MRKAPESDADGVIFDLEDAVAPGRKAEAREAVRDVLSDPGFDPDTEVCVRINLEDASADLEAVLGPDVRLDAVVVPKVTSAADVETVAALLAEAGMKLPILVIVETAAGVLAAREIALAPDTDALLFGAEDLTADLGATRTEEGTEMLYAREHVLLAARAAGVDAIDTVYPDFDDLGGLADETEFAATLGYGGKIAIHPSQVPVINDAFTPDDDQLAWAERVLDARDEARDESRGVFEVDGEMIDAPLIAQAERIVERARAAGVR